MACLSSRGKFRSNDMLNVLLARLQPRWCTDGVFLTGINSSIDFLGRNSMFFCVVRNTKQPPTTRIITHGGCIFQVVLGISLATSSSRVQSLQASQHRRLSSSNSNPCCSSNSRIAFMHCLIAVIINRHHHQQNISLCLIVALILLPLLS